MRFFAGEVLHEHFSARVFQKRRETGAAPPHNLNEGVLSKTFVDQVTLLCPCPFFSQHKQNAKFSQVV